LTIALVILHADPARGGAERYTVDLAAALAARGHEVSVLAIDSPSPIPGVRIVPLAAGGMTRRRRFRRFLDSLDAHLAAGKYDVVHAMLPVRRCDVYHPHAGLAAESMQKFSSKLNPRRRLFAAVERALLTSPRPPVALCLSDYIKRIVQSHYPLPPDRMATLFNAVDLARFDPTQGRRDEDRQRLSLPDDRIVALMVAQDFQRKGVHLAIEALKQAADPKLLLLVLGRDKPDPYKHLARLHGVAEQVRFAGAVDDPRQYYRAADFFLLPTRHDPCSLATLEALAMGLPVISTVFNGACQTMTDGEHGFVLSDPNDTAALAGAMRKLLDSQKRQAMSHACLALRPQLSYDVHLDRLLQIYASVAPGRAPR
jgi:UDP-glucose:(heptosyl)LPS alpha-1,3-glucosyltransferase